MGNEAPQQCRAAPGRRPRRAEAPRAGPAAAAGARAVLAALLAGGCPARALAARGGALRRAAAAQLSPPVYVAGTQLPGGVVVSRLGNGSVHGRHLLTIELGGQPLRVVADTGSFGLVVSSHRCPDWNCPVRKFNHAASHTYEQRAGFKVVKYMSGSVHLQEARDDMRLFDGPKRQGFWEIAELGYQMKDLWAQVQFDGILGLPWLAVVPGEGSANEATVTETFGVQSFTFCFGRATIRPYDQGGGVAVTPSFIYWSPPGALTWQSTVYAEVVSQEHWAVELGEVSVVHQEQGGPRAAKFACYGGLKCLALVDTGAKVMSVPHEAMFALENQLGGEVRDDCSNFGSLPDLTFTVGGVTLTMPPAAYVKRSSWTGHNPEDVTEICTLLIAQNDVALEVGGELIPLWILGVPFMQEFVVEFDRSRTPARIGMSPHPGRVGAAGECPAVPPTGPAGAAQLLAGGSVAAPAAARRPREVQLAERPTPDALELVGLGAAVVLLPPANRSRGRAGSPPAPRPPPARAGRPPPRA